MPICVEPLSSIGCAWANFWVGILGGFLPLQGPILFFATMIISSIILYFVRLIWKIVGTVIMIFPVVGFLLSILLGIVFKFLFLINIAFFVLCFLCSGI